jgi:cell division protein DivIC
MTERKIMPLNNHFVNQQMTNHQIFRPKNKKRRYLGLILIAVILVMTLSTINLIKSYQTLQEREVLKVTYGKKLTTLNEKIAVKKADVIKLKDPIFLEKYARAKHYYSKDGEKIFLILDLPDGGITTSQ